VRREPTHSAAQELQQERGEDRDGELGDRWPDEVHHASFDRPDSTGRARRIEHLA